MFRESFTRTPLREITLELYTRVHALHKAGESARRIAPMLNITRIMVGEILRDERLPGDKVGHQRNSPILNDREAELRAYHEGLRVNRELRNRIPRHDNLFLSIRYVQRSILAQEAGIYTPPEDREFPHCH